jgi:hypothetical protein
LNALVFIKIAHFYDLLLKQLALQKYPPSFMIHRF